MSKPSEISKPESVPHERQAKLPCDDDTGIDRDIEVVICLRRERYAHSLEKANAKFARMVLLRRISQRQTPRR
jgi:hypothetical protein